jgi:hypothetical protein
MPIDKKNLSGKLLNSMIEVTIELIDNYGIFTFDLKPANMGLLNRRPVLLDVGADCSHLIRPDCDTADYKSFMLLVLLVYCYNFRLSSELTRDQLQQLARHYIRTPGYNRLLDPNYSITTDPCLDLDSFNRRIAPSITTYTAPIEFLTAYSAKDGRGRLLPGEGLWSNILADLLPANLLLNRESLARLLPAALLP